MPIRRKRSYATQRAYKKRRAYKGFRAKKAGIVGRPKPRLKTGRTPLKRKPIGGTIRRRKAISYKRRTR